MVVAADDVQKVLGGIGLAVVLFVGVLCGVIASIRQIVKTVRAPSGQQRRSDHRHHPNQDGFDGSTSSRSRSKVDRFVTLRNTAARIFAAVDDGLKTSSIRIISAAVDNVAQTIQMRRLPSIADFRVYRGETTFWGPLNRARETRSLLSTTNCRVYSGETTACLREVVTHQSSTRSQSLPPPSPQSQPHGWCEESQRRELNTGEESLQPTENDDVLPYSQHGSEATVCQDDYFILARQSEATVQSEDRVSRSAGVILTPTLPDSGAQVETHVDLVALGGAMMLWTLANGVLPWFRKIQQRVRQGSRQPSSESPSVDHDQIVNVFRSTLAISLYTEMTTKLISIWQGARAVIGNIVCSSLTRAATDLVTEASRICSLSPTADFRVYRGETAFWGPLTRARLSRSLLSITDCRRYSGETTACLAVGTHSNRSQSLPPQGHSNGNRGYSGTTTSDDLITQSPALIDYLRATSPKPDPMSFPTGSHSGSPTD